MSAQRFFQLRQKTVQGPLLLLSLSALLGFTGCRVEHPASRVERAEFHLAKLANEPLPFPHEHADNDAERVISSCGQPNSDTVMPIYSKYYNGPVRRLEYVGPPAVAGEREVTLDFIPSLPKAELAYTEAPLPHAGYGYAELPANATWTFEAGQMEQEYIITAHRLGVYLPCAGEALRPEF